MKFEIHFTVNDYEDCVVVEGDTIEEIGARAKAEVAKRGGTDPWSKEIK